MNTSLYYQLVVALTGPIASGKGMVAKAIQETFGDISIQNILLSDYLREKLRANGTDITRDTLREAGNALRVENGPGALAKRMLEELKSEQEGILLVDSIRNPGEIAVLKDRFGDRLMVIATDAPIEDRIVRVLQRAREDDSTEQTEIARQMHIEMEDRPDVGFALERCRQMADVISIGRESKAERMEEIRLAILRFLEKKEANESAFEQHRAWQ